MKETAREIRRLNQSLKRQPKFQPGKPATLKYRKGTIASVTAGAASDGHAAVSVTIGSDTIPAPYLASYTPTVGDMVAVLLVGNSPLILGSPIGLPVV